LEALGLSIGYLIVQIVSFLILVILLRAWVYNPLIDMLERRRKTISQGLTDARIAGEERANAEKEAEDIIANAQQEAGERVREANVRVEQVAKEVKELAEREAVEILSAARVDAQQTKVDALGELRGQVASLAIAAAQHLIGEIMDEQRQQVLIDEFFSGIKGGKVIVLDNAGFSGELADVTSAMPLNESEQESVRTGLATILGTDAETVFHVDPNILGGLIIRVGDRVVDGSVVGKLQSLKQNLQ